MTTAILQMKRKSVPFDLDIWTCLGDKERGQYSGVGRMYGEPHDYVYFRNTWLVSNVIRKSHQRTWEMIRTYRRWEMCVSIRTPLLILLIA